MWKDRRRKWIAPIYAAVLALSGSAGYAWACAECDGKVCVDGVTKRNLCRSWDVEVGKSCTSGSGANVSVGTSGGSVGRSGGSCTVNYEKRCENNGSCGS